MPDRDEDTGQYTGNYSSKEFLTAIENIDGMAGTGDIADEIGCAHDTAYKRLQNLENDGLVKSQKVGNTLIWSVIN